MRHATIYDLAQNVSPPIPSDVLAQLLNHGAADTHLDITDQDSTNTAADISRLCRGHAAVIRALPKQLKRELDGARILRGEQGEPAVSLRSIWARYVVACDQCAKILDRYVERAQGLSPAARARVTE